ncbi:hypothetical protein ACT17_28080 [Mycolicibacterium conceptionense]|uniref:Uncharacterized protein n=1 Tax=Mycolicibacterium conceptionense TaxID=451644 RepID=A0A0J8WP74_9MYCO|nr:hypothetical protein [Mycolicibacterium conceptionense]KMV14824.1 hypothetical protein ACT17_28080 [Mycolicibacterium conceptionense]
MPDTLVWEVTGFVPSRSDGGLVEACTFGVEETLTDADKVAHDVLGRTLAELATAYSEMRLVEDDHFMDSEVVLGVSVTRYREFFGELVEPVIVNRLVG